MCFKAKEKKKFIIQCPKCKAYAEGETGFFSGRKVRCSCGYKINVKKDGMKTEICKQCGNKVTYNVRDAGNVKCLVCGNPVGQLEDLYANVKVSCPNCACELFLRKDEKTHKCPMCNTMVDVEACIKASQAKTRGHASLIKCENHPDMFVYKHAIEDFNCGSQLIVNGSQEALFFRDGNAYDVLGAGRYTLSAQDMPLLDEVYKMGEDIVVHTQVYFVNMITQMNIPWGINRLDVIDPDSKIHMRLGAYGTFNLKVTDSKKLVYNLVGTGGMLSVNDIQGGANNEEFYEGVKMSTALKGKFMPLIVNKTKAMLARIIAGAEINVFTLDQHIDFMSNKIKEAINEELAEYGLTMPQFIIIKVPIEGEDTDPILIRLKQQYAEKTLNVRDEEVKQAVLQARQDTLILEHETDAKLEVIDSQGYIDTLKMKNQAEAEAYTIRVKAEAEGYRIMAEAKAEGKKAGLLAEAEGEKAMLLAEAEALNAKGGDYEKETQRIIDSKLAEQDVTVVDINVETADKWACSCGKTGITSNFCPDCGAKKLTPSTEWNCACGTKGIKSKFCPDCGAKKS